MTLTMDTDRAVSTWRKATYAPLDASETCYVGSLLSRDQTDGYIHRLVAGESFAGIAMRRVEARDWKSTGAANGDIYLEFAAGRGYMQVTSFTGLTEQDAVTRRKVYASDDATFTFSPTTGPTVNNTFIGEIVEIISSTVAIVMYTCDEELDSNIATRAVLTLGTGAQVLTPYQANRVIRVDGTVNQSVTLPLMSTWIGKFFTIENAIGGGTITTHSNATDGSVINGAATLAQTASTIGKVSIFYSTGLEIIVIANT